jgi:hypothetical protein
MTNPKLLRVLYYIAFFFMLSLPVHFVAALATGLNPLPVIQQLLFWPMYLPALYFWFYCIVQSWKRADAHFLKLLFLNIFYSTYNYRRVIDPEFFSKS